MRKMAIFSKFNLATLHCNTIGFAFAAGHLNNFDSDDNP
jgi:hypothetical protein